MVVAPKGRDAKSRAAVFGVGLGLRPEGKAGREADANARECRSAGATAKENSSGDPGRKSS